MADLAAIERELETQPHRAEYLDELAYAYQQLGRFDDALDAMRQAVAAGWDGDLDEHPSAQALIADLLLHAGHTDEADDAWLGAEREDPRNPWLHQTAGLAYADVGLHSKALPWQTKGLTLALATETDSDMLWMLTSERAETLDALSQPPDELQLRAEELVERDEQAEQARVDAFYRDQSARTVPPERASVGLAWFPAQEYQRALETWPSFAEDYEHGPYEAYCARLELLLRDLKAQGVARLALVPITIDDYLAWSAEHDRDPEQSDTRASYATELLKTTATHPWPPKRNQACWCGTERKYKQCCYAPADTRHLPPPPHP